MKRVIKLEGMRFHAFHGVMPAEGIVGGEYLVSVKFEYDFTEAELNDNLSGTLDYSLVYDIVKQEMQIKSKLIEHVGGRIFKSLKSAFPAISSLSVSVCKFNPPITGEVQSATITIEE